MPGYVYRGNQPLALEGSDAPPRRIRAGNKSAPCGTEQATRRHQRNKETCDVCDPIHKARLEARDAARKEKRRVEWKQKNAERIASGFQKPTRSELKPCGTSAARDRHVRRGEPVDKECYDAYRADNREKRRKERARNAAKRLAELKEKK